MSAGAAGAESLLALQQQKLQLLRDIVDVTRSHVVLMDETARFYGNLSTHLDRLRALSDRGAKLSSQTSTLGNASETRLF